MWQVLFSLTKYWKKNNNPQIPASPSFLKLRHGHTTQAPPIRGSSRLQIENSSFSSGNSESPWESVAAAGAVTPRVPRQQRDSAGAAPAAQHQWGPEHEQQRPRPDWQHKGFARPPRVTRSLVPGSVIFEPVPPNTLRVFSKTPF